MRLISPVSPSRVRVTTVSGIISGMTPSPHSSSGLILSADRHRTGADESGYARACRRGELVRIRRGAYCEAREWESLNARDRYLLTLRAVAAASMGPVVFCGVPAAAVWNMPIMNASPRRVHVVVPAATGGRSRYGVVRHPVSETVQRVVDRDGILVTDVARTAVDVTLAAPFAEAVGSVDWALWQRNESRVVKQDIRRELARVDPRYRRRHAEAVIEFATDLSDSYGESMTRAVIHELGFPAPELQVDFVDDRGHMVVDYYWRREGIVGEFDGKSKYLRPMFGRELDPGERVWREKTREDRLRRQVRGVARIITSDVMNPARLVALLTEAGLRRR